MLRTFIILLGFAMAFVSTTYAQTKNEKQVAAAVEALRTAMVDGDKRNLDRITAATLSYGHSGGQIDDKKEFIEKLASGASDFVTIDISEQTITISGDTAIVRHILSAQTNDSGKPGTVKLKVLLVWQRLDGNWKLMARQAVKLT